MSTEVNWLGRINQIIKDKTHPIGIVGMGYVGLPLAVAFADKGFHVIGVDIKKQRVDDINSGISPIVDVKSSTLKRLVKKGFIEATDNHAELRKTFIIIMCVPTPLNKSKQPDLSYIEETSREIGRFMYEGSLIILESTSYPGTTRELVAPILEKESKGKKYFLAYSPERVDPSSRSYTLRNTPKLVSGIDEESCELAYELYSSIVKNVVKVSRPEIAETAKVFENVFRSVNIGLVNELAMMCKKMGLSVWEVLDAAGTKPFGFMRFNPSPGIGGHCFVPNTLVMTDLGPERIDEIKVGTKVLSDDGNIHKVLHVNERWYSGDMVTIKVRGLLPTTMTPDHKVYIANKPHSKINKVEAENLTTSDYTILPQKNGGGYVYHRVHSTKQSNYTGYVYNLWVEDTNNYVVPIGVVSNCIPVDPYYLDLKATEAGYHSRFIREAMDINENMPDYVMDDIARALDKKLGVALSKSRLLILGVAYKPDVGDLRESPSLEVLRKLYDRGAKIQYNDPFVPEIESPTMKSVDIVGISEVIKEVDCVVMLTNHSVYRQYEGMIIGCSKLLYDARGWSNKCLNDNIVRLGE